MADQTSAGALRERARPEAPQRRKRYETPTLSDVGELAKLTLMQDSFGGPP